MFRFCVFLFVSVLAGFAPHPAAAQGADDACLQQGFRPGSAAYHACVSASDSQALGMFDPMAADQAEHPNPAPDANSGDGWIQQLDRLGSDAGDGGAPSSGWDWSKPTK